MIISKYTAPISRLCPVPVLIFFLIMGRVLGVMGNCRPDLSDRKPGLELLNNLSKAAQYIPGPVRFNTRGFGTFFWVTFLHSALGCRAKFGVQEDRKLSHFPSSCSLGSVPPSQLREVLLLFMSNSCPYFTGDIRPANIRN